MKWTAGRSGRTALNVFGEDDRWIATVYMDTPDQTFRTILKAPEMLELLKVSNDPESKKLVEYIQSGRL
ncbi:hypothetical protein HPY27_01420 [Brevibacillus sp. HB1.1]|uniref:hypothetical protein n=1 Tax=Brevibacillus sp. HB1.1 TaxID=2738808 RepID=UPI0015766694|nr:hypothetical protein [Brevibacillus sp. HB1.1]NTU28820.1 hypothetical protein [Brevibacillus sp. HB1.1]